MSTLEARLALADRIASATGGKPWNKGDYVRVYTSRPGKAPAYYDVVSATEVRCEGAPWGALVKAGIVAETDITAVLPLAA